MSTLTTPPEDTLYIRNLYVEFAYEGLIYTETGLEELIIFVELGK